MYEYTLYFIPHTKTLYTNACRCIKTFREPKANENFTHSHKLVVMGQHVSNEQFQVPCKVMICM